MLSDFYISTWVDATARYQARFTDYAYFYEFAYRSKLDTFTPKWSKSGLEGLVLYLDGSFLSLENSEWMSAFFPSYS